MAATFSSATEDTVHMTVTSSSMNEDTGKAAVTSSSATEDTEDTGNTVYMDEVEEVKPEPIIIDWKNCFRVFCSLQDEEHPEEPREFHVPYSFLAHLQTVSEMLDSLRMDLDCDTVIPLPQVAPSDFELVMEFVEARLTNPCELCPVLPDRKVHHPTLGPWATEWGSKLDVHQALSLMLAANYLCVKELVMTCAQTVAIRIAGKTTDQIRELLWEGDDLTPDMKKEIEEQTKYLDSKDE